MQITATRLDSSVLTLPWSLDLEEWPDTVLAAMPRGISRHTVRFVRLEGEVVVVKQIGDWVAKREYELLRRLEALGLPTVEPLGYVTGRVNNAGEPLSGALLTKHLRYSLPYRTLFMRDLRTDTAEVLIDSLVALLVKLHVAGFFWGDVSLSNTLFLRDAESFAAYLVDAETGELHPPLTSGQREYDLEVARVNIIGELMDLAEAGQITSPRADLESLVAVGDQLAHRYQELWAAVTELQTIDAAEHWRVTERIQALNAIGFDVTEMEMVTTAGGQQLQIRPRVVDPKYHSTKLERLTGMVVEEKQARRLLTDMHEYAARHGLGEEPDEFIAHEWLTHAFEATLRKVPIRMRYRLAPAQMFHEILEHRWFISAEAQKDIPISDAVASYVHHVLEHRDDERRVLGQ